MNTDAVLAACAACGEAVEDYPFGDDVAVFKVGGKVFALISLTDTPGRVTLKCDPDWAVELRAQYAAVQPGYHTNKRHWNTVTLDRSVDQSEIQAMLTHSYELVLASLTKAQRASLFGV